MPCRGCTGPLGVTACCFYIHSSATDPLFGPMICWSAVHSFGESRLHHAIQPLEALRMNLHHIACATSVTVQMMMMMMMPVFLMGDEQTWICSVATPRAAAALVPQLTERKQMRKGSNQILDRVHKVGSGCSKWSQTWYEGEPDWFIESSTLTL